MPEPETPEVEEATAPTKSDRRRHRSAYPTPGFKAFGMLLHIIAFPLATFQLTVNTGMNHIVLGILAALGFIVALYSNAVRPLATNIKTRKILTGVVAGYGFLLLIAMAVTYLLGL